MMGTAIAEQALIISLNCSCIESEIIQKQGYNGGEKSLTNWHVFAPQYSSYFATLHNTLISNLGGVWFTYNEACLGHVLV